MAGEKKKSKKKNSENYVGPKNTGKAVIHNTFVGDQMGKYLVEIL